MPLARARLQDLATARLAEAEALFAAGHHSGAYYLAGYAVEFGLKACIAKQFRADEIPEWALTREFKTHDLSMLLRFAGLRSDVDALRSGNAAFDEAWQTVLRWTVDSRYEMTSAKRASTMLVAAGDQANGVLGWIRTRW